MGSFGAYKQVDPRSDSDAKRQRILEDTTYHDRCRYEVGIFWADNRSSLPNKYLSALSQLKSLERRLDKNPEFKNDYSEMVTSDWDKSYVVQVNKEDCFEVDCLREWYVAHHPVFHPHKPEKVRRVLDGAARFHGSSLNNTHLTRPDLLQSLIHVLIRFRQYQYAVSADIEGMFLQVDVNPRDQLSLRFLWQEDPSEEIAVYQYVRHNFGAQDSPTCVNYALKRSTTDNKPTFPEAVLSVKSNFSLDD